MELRRILGLRFWGVQSYSSRRGEQSAHAVMVEPSIEKLVRWNPLLPRGDSDLLKVYLEINLRGFDEEANEGSAEAWDRNKDALLPILVKDALEGCDQVQKLALELLGHLAAMAEDMSPFEPQQAISLWSTVARVLHDEAPKKLSKIMALIAIVNETMGPSLMEPSAPLLTSAIAKAMRHESAQARKHAAAAAFRLLGDAPTAMKKSAALRGVGTTQEDEDEGEMWMPCLLRLCLDDCVGVRAEALKAAKRAVSCVKRDDTIASWVLGRVRDGSLFEDMDRGHTRVPELCRRPFLAAHVPAEGLVDTIGLTRTVKISLECKTLKVMRHRDALLTSVTGEAAAQPVTREVSQLTAPQPSSTASKTRRTSDRGQAINAERVKHAVMAWAVHLSLADFESLDKCRDVPGNTKNAFHSCTDKFLSASAKFNHQRPSVRVEAMEAWGMFASSCLSNVTRHQAAKVTELAVRPMMRSVLKEREAVVREEAFSQLSRCVASFQLHSVKYAWRLPDKLERAGKIGLADFLRRASGSERGADVRHFCARMLAAVLPCSILPPGGPNSPCSLQRAGLHLAVELSPILSILLNLMQAFPSPSPDMIASSFAALSSPGKAGASATPLDALPTWALMARAWCGLVEWTILEHRASVSAPGDGCAGGNDDALSAEHASAKDKEQGDGAPGETSDGGTKSLSTLLRWLLTSGRSMREESVEDVASSDVAAIPSSSRPTPATAKEDTASNSMKDLAGWKQALLMALVRVLSGLPVTNGRRKGLKAKPREDCPEKIWMKLPVDLSPSCFKARSEETSQRAESCDRDCAKCEAARDVQGLILTDLGSVARDTVGVAAATRKRADQQATTPGAPVAPAVPLWVALLAGALGSRCDRHAPHRYHRREGAGCFLDHESGTKRPSAPASGSTLLCGGHSAYSSQSILTQILALSPPGAPARLISCLARGMTPPPSGRMEDYDVNNETRTKSLMSQSSCLSSLGRAWCAEAARNLTDWKSFHPNSREADHSVESFGTSFLEGRGRVGTSGALVSVVDQQQPDPELLDSTADALRSVLKSIGRFLRLASLVKHDPTACPALKSTFDTEKAAVDDVERSGKCRHSRDHDPTSDQGERAAMLTERGSIRRTYLHTAAPVEAVFGSRAAKLWRDLFAERRRYSPGFSGLVKKLAKDCAVLAFCSGPDTPAQSLVASSVTTGPASDLQGKSEAWGFVLSQSQPALRERGVKVRSLGKADSPSRVSTGTSNGEELLSRPPPLECLPIVIAATQALLDVAVKVDGKETDSTRLRAWGAALATLAWVLTSPIGAVGRSEESSPPASAENAKSEVLICLQGLRRTDALGKKIRRREMVVPVNEVSLAPVCRLVAVGLRRSYPSQSTTLSSGCRPTIDINSNSTMLCIAERSTVRHEILELALCVLAAMKGFRRELLTSPGTLRTLSPMLEAVLEIPCSSETDDVQSALIDTWNHTFGNLPEGTELQSSFPPNLHRLLARSAGLAEVKMPPGMAFETTPLRNMPANHWPRKEDGDEIEDQDAARSPLGQGRNPAGGASRCSSVPPGGGVVGVTGVLSAAGAARSFIRHGRGSSPTADTHPVKKSPLSPAKDASVKVGTKFLRVVGNGRGSGGRGRPTKRAAVTTHTSLDGSQAPWDDGSQLPETEPDSAPAVPEPGLLQDDVQMEHRPPVTSTCCTRTSPTKYIQTARTGKRSSEASMMGNPNASGPGRRVRSRNDAAADCDDSRDTELESGEEDADAADKDVNSEDQRMAATMAAIAKESSASTAEGNQRDTASLEEKVDQGPEDSPTVEGGGSAAAAKVAKVARELARGLEAAKEDMQSEELEEVHSLLTQALRRVRSSQGGQ